MLHSLGSAENTTSHTRNKWSRIHDFRKSTVTSVTSPSFQSSDVTLSLLLQISGSKEACNGFFRKNVGSLCWGQPDEMVQFLILSGLWPFLLPVIMVPDPDHTAQTAFTTITAFEFCPSQWGSLSMNFGFSYWKMKHPKAEPKSPTGRTLYQSLWPPLKECLL